MQYKILITLLFLWNCYGNPPQKQFPAIITKVHDGDSVFLLFTDSATMEKYRDPTPVGKTRIKARLYGIDCPELNQPQGKQAGDALRNLILADTVLVQEFGKDRYNRLIVDIWHNSIAVNQWLVQQGYCYWYQKYAPASTSLAQAQAYAQKNKLGIWSDSTRVAPWEWRSKGKKTKNKQ
jgi:micrococcal nuclease